MPNHLILRNAAVLDPADGSLTTGQRIEIEAGRITAVRTDDDDAGASDDIDVEGRIVSPGFIDAHVHVLGYSADLGAPSRESASYVAARASDLMAGMLRRGFTTVRDVGGADHGLVRAVEEGYLVGPRIFHGGPALSQTGGHGDFREAGEDSVTGHHHPVIGLVCDGVPAIRRAVRNEVRRGARHIKLMLGGGIASPTDRIDSAQFSDEEIRAAVEEATNANIYVTAHAYTSDTVARALNLGVRCIEHGTLIDEATADLFLEHDAFLVPTLGVAEALAVGATAGVTDEAKAKAAQIAPAGEAMLAMAHARGVKVVFGTDFIGDLQPRQSEEFAIRARVIDSLAVLRSATVGAAELLGQQNQLGRISPGYLADLVVLNVNPIVDVGALSDPDSSIDKVISRGAVVTRAGAALGPR